MKKRSNTGITVIIIAKDEEKIIGKALESILWVDEILVAIDPRTTDNTADIARKYKTKVIKLSRVGDFSSRKNLLHNMASCEWVFYLDADERATPELASEIKTVIYGQGGSERVAYTIPRRNILLGYELRHGGWWPDRVLRLMKKSALRGWRGELHEQPEIDGEVGDLKNPMIHITHRSLAEMVEKTNKWSEIEARLMFEANHPPMNIFRFLSAMFREFWYRGVLKLGFLDGIVGVIEIIYQVFSRFISYAKLWEMQNKNESRDL